MALKLTAMGGSSDQYPPTRWTQIRNAAGDDDDARREAWEFLCEVYWKPVYATILRAVKDNETAKDLTQDFFRRQIANPVVVENADPARGFRKYLWGRVQFMIREHFSSQKKAREKGTTSSISSQERDWDLADENAVTAEQCFYGKVAREMVQTAIDEAESILRKQGRGRRCDVFRLTQEGKTAREVAEELGIPEHTVKNGLREFRRTLADYLKAIVRETVGDDGQVNAELAELQRLMEQGGADPDAK